VTSYVFVLGAEFLRQSIQQCRVWRRKEVVGRLGDDIPYVPPGLDPRDFENWLSYLAEDQPCFYPRSNSETKAGFVRVSREISKIIIARICH
jgi:hypothetical protein